MNHITFIDPSIGTFNGGDIIIKKSINLIISELFPYSFITCISNRKKLDRNDYKLMAESKYTFVCGTNLISSNMLIKYHLWRIHLINSLYIKDILLFGVGWWQYQNKPNFYTRCLLRRILNKKLLHSVRDRYTQNMLRGIGITNTIFTSCPTTWTLTKNHCQQIPQIKSENVIFTLTDYNRKPEIDKIFLSILKRKYKKVYFWMQGLSDLDYLLDLGEQHSIHVIKPSVDAYEKILSFSNGKLDYIGTRLHAGIKSLTYKCRSLILAIDNRATEIAKDIHLPVLNRDKIYKLESFISSSYPTHITLPEKNIEIWKNQFSNCYSYHNNFFIPD